MNSARVLALFDELADLDAVVRAARLDALASEDADLAAAVRRMLAADAAERGVLDGALADALPSDAPPPDRSGQRIGAYRLVARIGRGGMGEVYRAEREGEYAQTVALKLLRRGVDSEDVVRRFVQERRILARLEHPGIARLIDGGMSADGLPWLAMELVDGEPVVAYAKSHALGLRQRIELLIAVCEALDFAHRRLIVHRDLKPSNVLVGADGAPRLLDFGIAKLLDQPEGETLTGTGVRVLSPAYAAPEQVAGEPIGIATDVYALGLLLYELLTGELPHGRREGTLATLTRDMAVEPERPSANLRSHAGADTTIAARALEGDLDTIVLKALAHEPDRRYASAAALAEDLRRHLDGRPIAARPDTLSYRLGKFVRRHRGGVAASLVTLLALVGGFGFALWQARVAQQQAVRADAEAQRAEAEAETAREMTARTRRVKDFLISVFLQEDPLRRDARGPLTMAEAFDDTLKRIDTELGDDPGLQGDLLDDFGEIVTAKGDFEQAQRLFERALANAEKAHGPDDPAVAESLVNLGVLAAYRGNLADGKPHLLRAAQILERTADSDPYALASVLMAVANVARNEGDSRECIRLMRRALELYGGPDGSHPGRIVPMQNLSVVLSDVGEFDEAEVMARRSVALIEETQGPDAPTLINTIASLEFIAHRAGRLDEEQQLAERRLAIARKAFAEDHPWTASALAETGWILSRSGKYVEGEARIAEGLAMYERLGADDQDAIGALRRLALSQQRRGDASAALATLDKATDACRRTGSAQNLMCQTIRANRAQILAGTGDPAVALSEADAALKVISERYAVGLDERAQALEARAAALQALDRHDEAVATQRDAIAVYTAVYGPQHHSTREAQARLDAISGG